jgi:hypothetical protein
VVPEEAINRSLDMPKGSAGVPSPRSDGSPYRPDADWFSPSCAISSQQRSLRKTPVEPMATSLFGQRFSSTTISTFSRSLPTSTVSASARPRNSPNGRNRLKSAARIRWLISAMPNVCTCARTHLLSNWLAIRRSFGLRQNTK